MAIARLDARAHWRQVQETQTWSQRLRWFVGGYWDGLILYDISLAAKKDTPPGGDAQTRQP